MKSKRNNTDIIDTFVDDRNKKSPVRRIGGFLLRFLSFVMVVAVLLAIALLTAIWLVSRGPSPTVQRLFVLTVKETSAGGFLADIFLSEEEVDLIMNPTDKNYEDDSFQTDTSLISISPQRPQFSGYDRPQNNPDDDDDDDDTGQTDDTSGVELHEVNGVGYRGYMLIVHDPKRVFVGTLPSYGGAGWSVTEHVNRNDALAGVNGGGFEDPDGQGSGGMPDGVVIANGVLRSGASPERPCVMGFDADGVLHVGYMSAGTAVNLGLKEAVAFGPALIINGTPQRFSSSGINPRTAIGQRADGAVLLLVVDGRQIDSLGATFQNLVDIFLEFGAVNAGNLDGGASTLMIYEGEVVNSGPTMIHPRRLPTTFLVRRLDEG